MERTPNSQRSVNEKVALQILRKAKRYGKKIKCPYTHGSTRWKIWMTAVKYSHTDYDRLIHTFYLYGVVEYARREVNTTIKV